MSAAHTPGPWRIEEYPYPHVRTVNGNECVMANDLLSPADALLIASAPTMFDYIETMAELGDMDAIKIMDSLKAKTAVEPNSVGTPQGVNQ